MLFRRVLVCAILVFGVALATSSCGLGTGGASGSGNGSSNGSSNGNGNDCPINACTNVSQCYYAGEQCVHGCCCYKNDSACTSSEECCSGFCNLNDYQCEPG